MDRMYDVIVIGAGHAGCEAAAAAANMGSKTLLITMDMNKIAQMSCNPAVGGIAKGQIVREIDALGGYMGIVTDRSAIQFRMLNKSKGAAMWSPRSQSDRKRFIDEWVKVLSSLANLYIWQDTVTQFIIEKNKVCGLITSLGVRFMSRSVVLTAGTFLNGVLHFGKVMVGGGRISEPASYMLTEQLKSLGFETNRMKTGTPCRIDKKSIDFSKMQEQVGDNDFHHFSFDPSVKRELKQMSCWITYTNPKTHDILRNSLYDSPLYNGQIKSIGPRYCPSIETKIVTFAQKDSHQLFVEPEGVDSNEYYLNGFSTSLPIDVQIEAIHTIVGLENAVLYRPGYAIEYDFFDPTQLHHTLATKLISNLFFAGQINGTTGYEEAAGQGIVAGINAHLVAHSVSDTFTIARNEGYIGVLIDDLVNKGVDEPYRMFTSRAEHRILLRQDNADARLTRRSYDIGLADRGRLDRLQYKEEEVARLLSFLRETAVYPNEINSYLSEVNGQTISGKTKISDILSRPMTTIADLENHIPSLKDMLSTLGILRDEIQESAEISVKYEGYIRREEIEANKLSRLDSLKIPLEIDYNTMQSLSTEARQKLSRIKPATIGDAARIPGVSPNDISVLLVLVGR